MVWVDWFIIGIAVISAIFGVFRGLVREVLAIASWIAAAIIAYVFADDASVLLQEYVSHAEFRVALAGVGLFLTVLITCAIITYLITTLVKHTHLTGTDRTLGFVFGLLRAGLILVVLVMFGRWTGTAPEKVWWKDSAFIPHLEDITDTAVRFFPDSWKQKLPPAAIEKTEAGTSVSVQMSEDSEMTDTDSSTTNQPPTQPQEAP